MGLRIGEAQAQWDCSSWLSFRQLGVPYFGVPIVSILVFRVITILGSPTFGNSHVDMHIV